LLIKAVGGRETPTPSGMIPDRPMMGLNMKGVT
jgi:hypothetical protein